MYLNFHCDDQGIELLASLFKRTALECGANADTATKKLFEDLVLDEERHVGRVSGRRRLEPGDHGTANRCRVFRYRAGFTASVD